MPYTRPPFFLTLHSPENCSSIDRFPFTLPYRSYLTRTLPSYLIQSLNGKNHTLPRAKTSMHLNDFLQYVVLSCIYNRVREFHSFNTTPIQLVSDLSLGSSVSDVQYQQLISVLDQRAVLLSNIFTTTDTYMYTPLFLKKIYIFFPRFILFIASRFLLNRYRKK